MKPAPFFHPAFRGKFGVARRDISPPPGIYSRNWGAAKTDIATSLHRPLTVTALIIQEEAGGDPLALIALDLGWWRSAEEETLLGNAVMTCGIKPGHYMLALSHTHSGPVFCRGESEKPGGELIDSYLRHLEKQVSEATTEALQAVRPGLLEVATGKCGLAGNRDLPDPDKDRLIVGWNPDLPADDTLLVGRVSDEAGNCLATIANYACHPTILAWENTSISPDFIGAMREVVETETAAPCLFLQAASGELSPRHQYVGDPKVADRAGRCLGHAVLGVNYEMLLPGDELAFEGSLESGASLAIWSVRQRPTISNSIAVRDLAIEHPLKQGFPSVEELQEQIAACTDRVLGERLQRRLLHRKSLGDSTATRRVHHLWRVGDILLISIPDEAYSEMQMELRQTAGKSPVLLATVTNGSRGYLSPHHSYAADSYAAGQSPYAAGCFEKTLSLLQSEMQKLS